MRGYLLILFSTLLIVNLQGQNYSMLYDFEPTRNERGGRVIEYGDDLYVSSSLVCLSNDNQCYFISRLTKDGEIKWSKKFNWIDKANWETICISNDTILAAGHANGTTGKFASSYLLHRMTIEGDSLDVFEYPTEVIGYSSSFSYGVIEYKNEYYIYGAARRAADQVVVGLILRINKAGELIQRYEYEGGLASHVFALQVHPSLGLVFIDEEDNGIGNPRFRNIIQVHLDKPPENFTKYYSLQQTSGTDAHLTTLAILENGTMVLFFLKGYLILYMLI